jgi:hypothetical protein
LRQSRILATSKALLKQFYWSLVYEYSNIWCFDIDCRRSYTLVCITPVIV